MACRRCHTPRADGDRNRTGSEYSVCVPPDAGELPTMRSFPAPRPGHPAADGVAVITRRRDSVVPDYERENEHPQDDVRTIRAHAGEAITDSRNWPGYVLMALGLSLIHI